MASINSWPNNQDEYRGAEDVMKWLHGRTSGVFAADGNAAVAAVQNSMAVTVSDGLGWMADAGKDGIVWWNDYESRNSTKLQLTIDAADSTLNRIDRVIVEWKTTTYVDRPEIKILKGTAASSAVAPQLTNNSTLRQLSLARINIAAGTTALTPSMITDERLDSAVCGLVTESISIDTSTMQNQFEALLALIEGQLDELKTQIGQAAASSVVDNSVTTPKLVNGAVTREKQAMDTMYSPLKVFSADGNITADDCGKTCITQYSADTGYTHMIITEENNAAMPIGYEVAICRIHDNRQPVVITYGIRFIAPGAYYAAPGGNIRITIPEQGEQIALKKFGIDEKLGDYWLLVGNADVEVVTS